MPKKSAKEGEGKPKLIAFTFRVPDYLTEAWIERKKGLPFRSTHQSYLEGLVERDLVAHKLITQEAVDQVKESRERSE